MGVERRPMRAEPAAPPPPGRILMTTDTVGGVWHYTLQLAGSLARMHQVQVTLAAMGGRSSPAQRREVSRLEGVTLHERRFRLEWMENPWDDVERAGEWLLALEAQCEPDVVHLNQFAFGALPFKAPTLLVAHSCVVSWWQAVHRKQPPKQWDRYRAVVSAGLADASQVAAPTRNMLMSLTRDHGFRGKGLVLPNGRDPQPFAPTEKLPLIMAAGRLWDEAKNVRALERVAPDVSWPIEVAGPTRAPDGSVRQADGLCLLGELPGDELARRLARSSIFVHPARYEPFGLAPLEAALAGCALVLGDIPSLREVWGRGALYVAPDDHAALAQALQRLIDDPDLLRQMSRRAREAAAGYSGAAMTRAYVAAYRQIAAVERTRLPLSLDAKDLPCTS
jgi:glycosyltransferase involved in cell wall biosynthesis